MCAKRTPVRAVRELPAQPNLEHLKNEAKQRLKALRAGNPSVKLAEAQLTLARDYGFASWRQLKAHVEKASADRPHRANVFHAAMAGDVETVRSALACRLRPAADGRRRPDPASDRQGVRTRGDRTARAPGRGARRQSASPARRGREHARRRGERPRRQAARIARCASRPDRRAWRQLPAADGPAQGCLAKPARLRRAPARARRQTCAFATPATMPRRCISRRKPPTSPS